MIDLNQQSADWGKIREDRRSKEKTNIRTEGPNQELFKLIRRHFRVFRKIFVYKKSLKLNIVKEFGKVLNVWIFSDCFETFQICTGTLEHFEKFWLNVFKHFKMFGNIPDCSKTFQICLKIFQNCTRTLEHFKKF